MKERLNLRLVWSDINSGIIGLFEHEGRILAMYHNKAYEILAHDGVASSINIELRKFSLGNSVLVEDNERLKAIRDIVRMANSYEVLE